jgi:hypothetical protein
MGSNGEQEVASSGLSLAAKRLLGILAYYIVAGIAIALAWRFVPSVRSVLEGGPQRELASSAADLIYGSRAAVLNSPPEIEPPWNQGTTTLLVLLGSLMTALPVAWVYSLTRRRRGFEQSMVHILVLLPMAVAGMVVLVQNNLALAFSLAGIVAVLRFRNTLDDVKDGVYIFICISIGMSAAVGAIAIGIVTSIAFNICVLMLWWIDFARRPTPGIRGGIRRLARLPTVAPPRRTAEAPAAAVGSQTGDEVFAAAARAWRRQLQLTAEHRIAAPAERFNAALRVRTASADASRPAVEALLRTRTKGWELKGILPGEGGTVTLKYHVRVGRSARDALVDAVRADPQTIDVELR